MALKVWLGLFIVFIVYSGLVYTQGDTPIASRPDEHIKNGWKIWQEKNCQSCHQLYGLGGYMGPDLTNAYSAKEKGHEYMVGFIKNGTGRMPNYRFSDADVADLVSFLAWVDKSGSVKVQASSVHWTGTYMIND